jgi:membrane-associated protein
MLEDILLFIDLFNPEAIIQWGGLALLLTVIFIETGVFFGFFLPGDSLVFTAGLLANSKYIDLPIFALVLLLILAAVAGSTVGFYTGRWAELYLKTRKENFFYKRKFIDIARDFYTKHGMLAFIFGRFLPIVRTFTPILAGLIRIDPRTFFVLNITGAAIWIATMCLGGYYLGKLFPTIINSLDLIVPALIIITAVPVYMLWRKERSGNS